MSDAGNLRKGVTRGLRHWGRWAWQGSPPCLLSPSLSLSLSPCPSISVPPRWHLVSFRKRLQALRDPHPAGQCQPRTELPFGTSRPHPWSAGPGLPAPPRVTARGPSPQPRTRPSPALANHQGGPGASGAGDWHPRWYRQPQHIILLKINPHLAGRPGSL